MKSFNFTLPVTFFSACNCAGFAREERAMGEFSDLPVALSPSPGSGRVTCACFGPAAFLSSKKSFLTRPGNPQSACSLRFHGDLTQGKSHTVIFRDGELNDRRDFHATTLCHTPPAARAHRCLVMDRKSVSKTKFLPGTVKSELLRRTIAAGLCPHLPPPGRGFPLAPVRTGAALGREARNGRKISGCLRLVCPHDVFQKR